MGVFSMKKNVFSSAGSAVNDGAHSGTNLFSPVTQAARTAPI
jgi:hypothetical protein